MRVSSSSCGGLDLAGLEESGEGFDGVLVDFEVEEVDAGGEHLLTEEGGVVLVGGGVWFEVGNALLAGFRVLHAD